ncbi:hypothetical protein GCM10018966_040260 [Streptomyces yanii]
MSQALRGQRQHHLVHAGQTPPALLDDLRLKVPATSRGTFTPTGPTSGKDSLGTGAITAVAAVPALDIVLVMAKVIGDLALQGALQDPLGQLPKQPARTGQLQSLGPGPVDQHPGNWSSDTVSTAGTTTGTSTAWVSTMVSLIRRLLDRRIRR